MLAWQRDNHMCDAVHYVKTANGRPACEGYGCESFPAVIPAEQQTTISADTTCLWCQELIEADSSTF